MVDFINDHPNDNGPNSKLKSLYNVSKANWMLKYGTMIFQPHHMNYILVETWEDFTVSAVNIIMNRFSKTCLLPLSPTNMITNTQACVASAQTSSKGINNIPEDTISPIKLQVTTTKEPMVTIRAKGITQQKPINILLRVAAYDTLKNRTVLPIQDGERNFDDT